MLKINTPVETSEPESAGPPIDKKDVPNETNIDKKSLFIIPASVTSILTN